MNILKKERSSALVSKQKRLVRNVALIVIAVFIIAHLLYGFISPVVRLKTTSFSVTSSSVTSSIRIVQLSDLHDWEHPKGNEYVVERISELKPDLVLITGDLVNGTDAETGESEKLLRAIVEGCGAPVYLSYGNHDVAYIEATGIDLKARWEALGATVVNRNYVDIEVNGNPVRIGGGLTSTFYGAEFLEDFENTSSLKLLLWHYGAEFRQTRVLDKHSIDAVFSGHAHGGQVVLPLIGPLVDPETGLFPGRLTGMFSSSDGTKHCFMNAGLGNGGIPRFNNCPEIVCVDFLPGTGNNIDQ